MDDRLSITRRRYKAPVAILGIVALLTCGGLIYTCRGILIERYWLWRIQMARGGERWKAARGLARLNPERAAEWYVARLRTVEGEQAAKELVEMGFPDGERRTERIELRHRDKTPSCETRDICEIVFDIVSVSADVRYDFDSDCLVVTDYGCIVAELDLTLEKLGPSEAEIAALKELVTPAKQGSFFRSFGSIPSRQNPVGALLEQPESP